VEREVCKPKQKEKINQPGQKKTQNQNNIREPVYLHQTQLISYTWSHRVEEEAMSQKKKTRICLVHTLPSIHPSKRAAAELKRVKKVN
jgi:hypothetical protein